MRMYAAIRLVLRFSPSLAYGSYGSYGALARAHACVRAMSVLLCVPCLVPQHRYLTEGLPPDLRYTHATPSVHYRYTFAAASRLAALLPHSPLDCRVVWRDGSQWGRLTLTLALTLTRVERRLSWGRLTLTLTLTLTRVEMLRTEFPSYLL